MSKNEEESHEFEVMCSHSVTVDINIPSHSVTVDINIPFWPFFRYF